MEMSSRLKVSTLVPVIVAFILFACLGTTTMSLFNAPTLCCNPAMRLSPWEHAGINFFISFLTLGAIGTIIAAYEIYNSTKHVRMLLSLGTSEVPRRIKRIFTSLDLADRVVVVDTKKIAIFCFGFLRPRICISRGAINILAQGELRAAVLHEAHHCRMYDPLRILIMRALSQALFFLPIVGEWAQGYEIDLELRADKFAIKHAGKLVLARAIHCLTQVSSSGLSKPSGAIIAGITGGSARVAELLGDARQPRPRFSPHGLAQSGASLLIICMVLVG